MTHTPGSDHLLDSPWPPFLDRLDDEKGRAAFCEFAYRMLQVSPPRFFARIQPDRRQDVIQEVLLHCLRDGCRVLRRYRPQGKPFAAWFITVASNKAKDLVLSSLRREEPIDDVNPIELPNPGPSRSDPLLRERLLRCLNAMGEKCRTLLTLLLDDLKPAEVAVSAAQLLGYEDYSNRQASDDLRYCRGRLAKLLEAAGVHGE